MLNHKDPSGCGLAEFFKAQLAPGEAPLVMAVSFHSQADYTKSYAAGVAKW